MSRMRSYATAAGEVRSTEGFRSGVIKGRPSASAVCCVRNSGQMADAELRSPVTRGSARGLGTLLGALRRRPPLEAERQAAIGQLRALHPGHERVRRLD